MADMVIVELNYDIEADKVSMAAFTMLPGLPRQETFSLAAQTRGDFTETLELELDTEYPDNAAAE